MSAAQDCIARASAPAQDADVTGRLARGLGPGPFALVMLFVSPRADVARIAAETAARLPAAHVVGCTTAGEISEAGYDEGAVLALGFPARLFAAEVLELTDLDRLSRSAAAAAFLQLRQDLAGAQAHLPHEFALLLVDGLSLCEDDLASALAAGSGHVPLIGGSAGDGLRFRETLVLHRGRALRNAAVLSVLRGLCPVRALNMDHLHPTERRMVVTRADPAARIVQRINAEPAAREYARILGKDPALIDYLTFAAHPLAVRVGGRYHVRAVQRVLPSGELLFFSAIDAGVVLALTEPEDLPAHLDRRLSQLAGPVPPVAVLGFDCVLRRIEAEQKQLGGAVSEVLRRHRVWGFSTYGEQFGPLHVNHTLTGCAIYPPGTQLAEPG
ncbi:FIST signal transduction protein [Paracoccus binzhouensis]|uniref:FIST signal transduction protein n=1 Tax=Paracoccus binzhouensis TaxID=2796149 RepID=UPI0018EEF88C